MIAENGNDPARRSKTLQLGGTVFGRHEAATNHSLYNKVAKNTDDVGPRGRVIRLAAAVMIADGVAVDRARAKLLFELGDRLLD